MTMPKTRNFIIHHLTPGVYKFFQESRRHLKILDARRKCKKFSRHGDRAPGICTSLPYIIKLRTWLQYFAKLDVKGTERSCWC